jgi:hypothetical protein
MNPILVLMGLLVLSYLGSFLVGGRAVRGLGLPSGAEYVALGFLVGPQLLGLVERRVFEAFEPIAHVALGWLALLVGIDYGYVGHRRARPASLVLSTFGGLLTGSLTAAAVWAVCRYGLGRPTGIDRILLAGGVGAACAETTRHAVRWVFERHQARGPLSQLIAEVAYADDLVPLLAIAALFSLAPAGHAAAGAGQAATLVLPFWGWLGVTLALGVVLGGMTALLIGKEFQLHSSWGFLLGTSMLAIGTAARLGLSTLTVTFLMGATMGAVSPHHRHLRVMLLRTERPVLLPALLLCGARIDLHAAGALAWCIPVAVLARIAGKLLSGAALQARFEAARRGGPLLGLGLLSSGALSLCIGLAFALRFPGPVGDTVLIAATVTAVAGEFIAPVALRNLLRRAGEIEDAPAAPPPEPAAS